MKDTLKKAFTALLLAAVLCAGPVFLSPASVSANSAEPPSIIFLVNNPPDDLSIVLVTDGQQPRASFRQTAWEGYYLFYSAELRDTEEYAFLVSTGGESFRVTIDTPLQSYNNVFMLDLNSQRIAPGAYPLRSALLVALRVLLTLLLEGAVFWLYRYRQKRSWLVFLIVNLITQGLLNVFLGSGGSPLPGYLILGLVFGEIFVFAAEMIAFPVLLREHSRLRAILFAVSANLVSLIAGGFLISYLPV